MVAGLSFGRTVAEMAVKKAEEKTQDTEITKGERAGYTLAPIIQGSVDLLQGDSLETVGKKNMKAHVENYNTLKEKAEDCAEGPVPKWALPFTGGIGLTINRMAD